MSADYDWLDVGIVMGKHQHLELRGRGGAAEVAPTRRQTDNSAMADNACNFLNENSSESTQDELSRKRKNSSDSTLKSVVKSASINVIKKAGLKIGASAGFQHANKNKKPVNNISAQWSQLSKRGFKLCQ